MRKTMVFIAVLALLAATLPVGGVAAEAEPTFYVAEAAGCSTVTVDVGLRDNPGLVSFVLSVAYDDTALTLTETTALALTSLVVSPAEHNPITINWCEGSLSANSTYNGAFLRLTFAVKEGAAPGTYPITLSYSPEDTFNKDFVDVAFATESGSVTVVDHTYDAACDADCNSCGATRAAADHTYDDDLDATCGACGYLRRVEYPIHRFEGNSVSEELRGLAFHFTATVQGVTMSEEHVADYSAATITPDSWTGEVRLIALGAVVTNGDGGLTLNHINGHDTKFILAERLMDLQGDQLDYAVRIRYIPDTKRDAPVRARAVMVYEVDGNQVILYGDEITASINSALKNTEE